MAAFLEADTAAISRLETVTADLVYTTRAVASAVGDIDIGDHEFGPVALRFVESLRAAVAAHAAEIVTLGDLLTEASRAASVTATGYADAERDAARLIDT